MNGQASRIVQWNKGHDVLVSRQNKRSYQHHSYMIDMLVPVRYPICIPWVASGKKVTPQPMKDDDIVSDWMGEEKDEPFGLGDILPDDVRARPRAYLKYPRMSYQHEKYRELADRFEVTKAKDPPKRKHAAISDHVQAAEPSYKVQDVEIPQADELRGFATSVTRNLDRGFIVFGQPPWSRSVVRRGAGSYVVAIQCESRSSLVVSPSSDVVCLASTQINCAATTGEQSRDFDSHRIRARLDGTTKIIWEDSAAVQSIQRPSHGQQTLSTLGMTVRAESPQRAAERVVLLSRVCSEHVRDNLIALPSKLDGVSMTTRESQVDTLVLKRGSHWLSRKILLHARRYHHHY